MSTELQRKRPFLRRILRAFLAGALLGGVAAFLAPARREEPAGDELDAVEPAQSVAEPAKRTAAKTRKRSAPSAKATLAAPQEAGSEK